MTSRTLILGTSHVAAIQSAFKTLDKPDPRVDFFAVPAYLLPDLVLTEGGELGIRAVEDLPEKIRSAVMAINGGLSRPVAPYGKVVFVGHTVYQGPLMQMIASHGIQGLRPAPRPTTLLSRPAFRALAAATARNRMAQEIRALFGPVDFAVIPAPRRRLALQDPEEGERAMQQKLLANPEGLRAALLLAQEALVGAFAAEGVTLIPQPAETIGEDGFTRPEFGEGMVSIHIPDGGEGHPGDVAHMNRDFGALVWKQIAAWIG